MIDAGTDSPRYEGKPLLRLLECYVLWAIDELPVEVADTLSKMAPKLAIGYKTQGDWYEVIAQVMYLPPDMPSVIRDQWTQNLELATMDGLDLTPQGFAERFVDHLLTES